MDTGKPYYRLLLRLERFGALSVEDRQRLADLPLRVVNYSAGAEVVSNGFSSSRSTVVLSGFLFSHKQIAGSRRQITSFFVPGDVADLSTFYLPRINHRINALGPAVVAFVPNAALKEMLDNSPALAQAFWCETLMQAA